MTFASDQVTVTMLVLLLGLIAIIVALRIRRSEQAKPKLSAAYAVAPQTRGIERDAVAALAARRRRLAQYPITPHSADLRDPSSETWGTIHAKSVDDQRYVLARNDRQLAQPMATDQPTRNFTQRSEDMSIDHPDVVQYL